MLREHCEAEGRDYDEIEKTVVYRFDVGEKGERASEIVDDIARLAGLGIQVVHGSAARVWDPATIEVLGEKVAPAVASL